MDARSEATYAPLEAVGQGIAENVGSAVIERRLRSSDRGSGRATILDAGRRQTRGQSVEAALALCVGS